MKTKNVLPLKWMLVIVVGLSVVVFRAHQVSKYIEMHPASYASKHNNFFQFLSEMLGIAGLENASDDAINKNNLTNRHAGGLDQMGSLTGKEQNSNSTLSDNGPESQGSTSGQEGNKNGNTSGLNAESNAEGISGNKPEGASGSGSDEGSGASQSNSESNSELNAENNSETNADQGIETLSGTNAENNAENNSENNAVNNAENNSGGTTGPNGGNNSGNPSGNNPGDNSDNNSGDNTGDNSGGNTGITIYPNNLPTLNPIPSNNQVSQSISQQNKNDSNLAALLAARQALVYPVQQEAEASKYVNIDPKSIPPVSTNPAPSDTVAKIKSTQVTVTH